MTSHDLIEFITRDTGMYKKDVDLFYKSLLEGIKRGLVLDGRVALNGVGVFYTTLAPERMRRDPRTEEKVYVPPRKYLSFRPSVRLKHFLRS